MVLNSLLIRIDEWLFGERDTWPDAIDLGGDATANGCVRREQIAEYDRRTRIENESAVVRARS